MSHLTHTTLFLKKVPTFKLSVTLSTLNRFSKFFPLPESVWNLLQNPYNNSHPTLGMLLHYLGKIKFKFSTDIQQIWKKMKTVHFCYLQLCYLSTNFDIFGLQNREFFPYWLQIKFLHVTVFYLFTFAINLWHRKFVMTAVFVNNQHGIHRQGQDFDKNT